MTVCSKTFERIGRLFTVLQFLHSSGSSEGFFNRGEAVTDLRDTATVPATNDELIISTMSVDLCEMHLPLRYNCVQFKL